MEVQGAAKLREVQALAITFAGKQMDRDLLLFFSLPSVRHDFKSPGRDQISGTSLESCLYRCVRAQFQTLLPEEEELRLLCSSVSVGESSIVSLRFVSDSFPR